MKINKYIKNLRISSGFSQRQLALYAEISNATISRIESGDVVPDAETLTKLAKALRVEAVSLFEVAGYINKIEKKISHNKGIKIPVLGRVPAGIPIEAVEDIIDWEEIPIEWVKNGDEYFGLQVNGDSMSPKYIAKDVVIIKKQSSCDSGQDAIVIVNGEDATLKKLLLKNDGIVLQPLNHDFEPLFFNNKDIEDLPVLILGVVVELRRKII